MIIVHLEHLMRKKAYEDGKKLNLNIVAKETGISFPTLHNIINKKNNSTSTAILDKLCRYFNCTIFELLEYKQNSQE